ncbi:MAG: ABC-F family ATP-binding cassette domain-containing protein [Bacteroidales bacterium]|nr:ABC-F family ATP-binding cassette domain-containing protein [Bacteroidales bacterium]
MAQSVPYLQVDHLTKSFGDLLLFEDISFGVAEGERIALIAQNGRGKSTLLNILAGDRDYDAGSVVFRRDLRVSCLPQEPQFDDAATVMQACFRTESETVRVIARYEQKIRQDGEQVMDAEMEQLLHLMDFHQAWDYEVRVKQILTRLSIPDFSRPMGCLSGGERKRVALANALISEPELLILDEPTNHLDLPMTEWLEKYLVKSGITLLMVTHDRYFLDRVCTRILEIDDRRLYNYNGNYSYYLEKRQERIDASNANLARANNLFRYELEWMRRTPSARGTKARARKDAFYDLKEQVSQSRREEQLQLDVKATYIGSKIFEAKYISKAYGDQVILDRFYYNFARYEKLGIVGRNGSGKSTFLKLLLGLEPCDEGAFDIGETVTFGYYSQDGLQFDESKKVIDVVREISDDITLSGGRRLSASQFLNHFLFTPETQHNYVHKLSGGEKRRLYLCTVLMRNPNFLVLDEPTNDLDIVTLNILEEYLRSFKGCVLVVSHDRYFMDKIVDHLLVFEGNGKVQDFPGNYTQYRQWQDMKDEEERRQRQSASALANKDAQKPAQTIGNASGTPRRKNRRTYKEQKEYEALEQEIAALETRKQELENALAGGQLESGQIEAYCRELPQLKETLDAKELRWLELDEIEG